MPSGIEYVLEGIRSGTKVIDIIKGLRGAKPSAEERWYIDMLVRAYQLEELKKNLTEQYDKSTGRLVSEYDNNTEHITNHLSGIEKAIERYYGKIEGLIEGLLLGEGYRKPKP